DSATSAQNNGSARFGSMPPVADYASSFPSGMRLAIVLDRVRQVPDERLFRFGLHGERDATLAVRRSRTRQTDRRWEDWRVTSRFPFGLGSILCPFLLTLIVTLAGCGDEFNAGPIRYVENERVATELKAKPDLQKLVRAGLAELFGPDPQHITLPDGTGLPDAGI